MTTSLVTLPENPGQIAFCSSLVSVFHLIRISAWLWFGASVLYASSQLVIPGEVALYLVGGLLWTAAGLWVLVSFIGYTVLMRLDRARVIVANRMVGCTALTAVSIGGPAAVIWVLLEVFS